MTRQKRANVLGTLCKRNHDYQGTGLSLRFSDGNCIECVHFRYAKLMEIPEKRIQKTKTQREIDKRNASSKKSQRKEYYERNKDAIRLKARKLRLDNADYAKRIDAEKRDRNRENIRKISKESKARQRAEKPEEVRAYQRERYKKNTIAVRIRNRVSKALRQKNIVKNFTVEGYGIDVVAIEKHIGKCPGNPKEWHIDHIRPLASFDFSDLSQISTAFCPENHQWLPARENLIKSYKYDKICTQN